MPATKFTILQVDWLKEHERIAQIRKTVFVDEQGVPVDEEMDEYDNECWFVLAEDDEGKAIGTGRLLPDGKIGRMAVLKPYRNRGVGSAILKALVEVAKAQSICELYLHGQVHAIDFYTRHGFIEEGQVFDEAGIPHKKMRMTSQS